MDFFDFRILMNYYLEIKSEIEIEICSITIEFLII